MRGIRPIHIWIMFGLVSLLTWIVYLTLTMLHSYRLILAVLSIVNFLLGVWLLIKGHFAWRTVVLVGLGLIVGQWWLILWSVVLSIWSINGFAP
jgi:hypothetical protein